MRRVTVILTGVVGLVLGIVGYAVRERVLGELHATPWWRPAWTALCWGLVMGGSWLVAYGVTRRAGEPKN